MGVVYPSIMRLLRVRRAFTKSLQFLYRTLTDLNILPPMAAFPCILFTRAVSKKVMLEKTGRLPFMTMCIAYERR